MKNSHYGRLVGSIVLAVVALCSAGRAAADRAGDARDQFQRPATIPFPRDNPYSAPKAALGERLFFDPVLSASMRQSCASCHHPDLGWSDGLARAVGDRRVEMSRRSPTLLNGAWLARLGWAGQFADLESVGLVAITGAAGMNLPAERAVARLRARPDYADAFARAFPGDGITPDTVGAALATFERTIVSGEAPFDRWMEGDEGAVAAAAKRGFALFDGKAGCAECHSGWSFTDGSFHDIGSATGDDLGRGLAVPTSTKLRYAFKTPTLRDVALRAPYMHDGSIATLEAVIDLYDRGGIARPSRSELIHPLGLTEPQRADLLAFLHTLTSDTPAARPTASPLP